MDRNWRLIRLPWNEQRWRGIKFDGGVRIERKVFRVFERYYKI